MVSTAGHCIDWTSSYRSCSSVRTWTTEALIMSPPPPPTTTTSASLCWTRRNFLIIRIGLKLARRLPGLTQHDCSCRYCCCCYCCCCCCCCWVLLWQRIVVVGTTRRWIHRTTLPSRILRRVATRAVASSVPWSWYGIVERGTIIQRWCLASAESPMTIWRWRQWRGITFHAAVAVACTHLPSSVVTNRPPEYITTIICREIRPLAFRM